MGENGKSNISKEYLRDVLIVFLLKNATFGSGENCVTFSNE